MGVGVASALSASKSGHKIYVADKNASIVEKVTIQYGVESDQSYNGLSKAEAIIIAVKPQDLETLAADVGAKISEQTILLSIVAGVTIEKIQKLFRHDKVVRVMPNMGLKVGEGIAAWKSSELSQSERERVNILLNDLSVNFEVNSEELIDAVTAISGSGPAYFFLLAQAMEKSAQVLGLDKNQARLLVEKTLFSAAALQKGASYEDLIKSIASKGGTTEAALKTFHSSGFEEMVEKAVRAAKKRSQELSNE